MKFSNFKRNSWNKKSSYSPDLVIHELIVWASDEQHYRHRGTWRLSPEPGCVQLSWTLMMWQHCPAAHAEMKLIKPCWTWARLYWGTGVSLQRGLHCGTSYLFFPVFPIARCILAPLVCMDNGACSDFEKRSLRHFVKSAVALETLWSHIF